jgi:tRNA threonylcarbamoyladenosine biosynthesis protein TsaB
MPTDSRILILETTGRLGSVAVADAERVLASKTLPYDARHASGLHAAIDTLVRAQGWPPDSLTDVYVSGGPGSFTGVRIGITVARTLALALGARLVRVPTVDALAENARTLSAPPQHLAVALDARRKQIFFALFKQRGDGTYEKQIDATMIDPTEAITDATKHLAGEPIAVLGEGVAEYRAQLGQAGAIILSEETWSARAESVYTVAKRMATNDEFIAAAYCVPLYVRLPDPEEKWQAKRASEG